MKVAELRVELERRGRSKTTNEVECMTCGGGEWHRPCGCCRRADYVRFMECWQTAMPKQQRWTAATVDAVLHGERFGKDGRRLLHAAALDTLPDGVFVALPHAAGESIEARKDCFLKWAGKLHRWSHTGYQAFCDSASPDQQVQVLTPPSLVAAMRQGFRPRSPHPSALTCVDVKCHESPEPRKCHETKRPREDPSDE